LLADSDYRVIKHATAKADAYILGISGRDRPKGDPHIRKFKGCLVPEAVNFYSDAGNLSCIEVSSIYEHQ